MCVCLFHDTWPLRTCVCVCVSCRRSSRTCVCVFLRPQVIENASSQKDTAISALYSSFSQSHPLQPLQALPVLSECLSRLSTFWASAGALGHPTRHLAPNASFLMCLMHCLLLLSARRLELLSNPLHGEETSKTQRDFILEISIMVFIHQFFISLFLIFGSIHKHVLSILLHRWAQRSGYLDMNTPRNSGACALTVGNIRCEPPHPI